MEQGGITGSAVIVAKLSAESNPISAGHPISAGAASKGEVGVTDARLVGNEASERSKQRAHRHRPNGATLGDGEFDRMSVLGLRPGG